MINVKVDFNAIGDGVADDTDALQQAADAAWAQTKLFTPTSSPLALPSTEATFPSVYFPAGHYRITDTIDWGGYVNLIADGSVMIRFDSSLAGPSFQFSNSFMVRLDGFTFVSGPQGIGFTNNNLNGARLTVSNCRFQGITGPALLAKPQPASQWFSSHLTVTGCKWFNCQQAMVSQADVTTISDSWFQWTDTVAPANTKHIDIQGGNLLFSRSLLVPWFPGASPTDPNGNKGCRWIGWTSTTGHVGPTAIRCEDVLFHGEEGGLPIVELGSGPEPLYPFQGPSIVLRGCQLSSGKSIRPDSAVINLTSTGLPQTVVVDGCAGLIGPNPLIREMVAGSTQTLLDALRAVNSHIDARIRILVGANTFYPLIPAVPTALTSPVNFVKALV